MSLYDIVKSYDGALDLVVPVSGESRRKLFFFLLIFKICFQAFFSFPERQEKVKENWQRDLGVFPSRGNYLEEPIGFVR